MKRFISTGVAMAIALSVVLSQSSTAMPVKPDTALQVLSLEKRIKALERRLSQLEDSDINQDDEISNVGSEVANLSQKVDGIDTEPTSLAKKILAKSEKYIYQVTCGGFQGSAFGVSIKFTADDTAKGYAGALITNHHVVENCLASTVKVTQNGRNLGGYVAGWDRENDLALIKTIGTTEYLPIAKQAPSRGDFVVALGSPYGLEGSISTGVVSNLYGDFVTTDAAVDPGNSGGPLLNSSGELLGINTWRFTQSQGNSFAIKPGVICRGILVCPIDSWFLSWSK